MAIIVRERVRMRALLIFNPSAGRAKRFRLAGALGILRDGGWQVEAVETDAHSGARAAARAGLATGHEVLIAAGGDGTLSQIAGAVAAGGPSTRPHLAILPFGTANVYARDLGLPLDPQAAARALLAARPRPAPLGRALFADGRERTFICFASCGFDALIIHKVSRAAKRRFGVAAFIAQALWQMPRYRFPPLTVIGDGAGDAAQPATTVVCTLTRHYAGPFALYPKHMAGQAYLLTCRGGLPRMALQMTLFLASAVRCAPGVAIRSIERLRIEGAGAPVQLDGEAEGYAPVAIEIRAAALSVLAP